MPSDSLIAPVDMIRFAAVYLMLVLLPGYILATAASPHRTRLARIVLAVPCGYSVVAIYGLATALLRLPFSPVAYAAIAVVIALAGSAAIVKQHQHSEPRARTQQRWWVLPVGVAAIEGAICALIHVNDIVPAAVDALSHVIWTQSIARMHVFPIALLSPHLDAATGGFYPPVFHAVTALVAGISMVPVQRAVFLSALAPIVVLPAALFAYVEEVTGNTRLAALAVLASLAFEPLPFWALAQGLYPLIASYLFIPALVLTLVDGLGRGRKCSVVLASALGIGLFYTHPTEFLTVGLLLLPVLPALVGNGCSWRRRIIYGCGVLATWAIAALPALAAVRRTMIHGAQVEIRARHDFTAPPHVTLGHISSDYIYGVYGRNLSYILGLVVVVGLLWCLAHRRFLGLVIAQILLMAVFADTESLNVLHPFYTLSFPWALMERLAPTHYWIAVPLAALGLDALLRAGQRLLWSRQHMRAMLVAAPCVALGLLLPLDVATRHTMAYSAARRVVAPSDLGAIAWLAQHEPGGGTILNDEDATHPDIFDIPIDAGRWMPVLGAGAPSPLFQHGGAGPGTWADRLYLLQHIADAPLPPRAARLVYRYHVRYVFYGAAVPPRATRHLNLSHLLRDPGLHLVYPSASLCQGYSGGQSTMYPATASYVFAIDGSDEQQRKAVR